VGGRNYRPGSDQRIAWQSVDGSLNAGTITFEELGPDRTLVTATIEYEPEGFVEKAGDALGLPSGRNGTSERSAALFLGFFPIPWNRQILPQAE
jgi:hypothetical protein